MGKKTVKSLDTETVIDDNNLTLILPENVFDEKVETSSEIQNLILKFNQNENGNATAIEIEEEKEIENDEKKEDEETKENGTYVKIDERNTILKKIDDDIKIEIKNSLENNTIFENLELVEDPLELLVNSLKKIRNPNPLFSVDNIEDEGLKWTVDLLANSPVKV